MSKFLVEPVAIKTTSSNTEEFGDIKEEGNDYPVGIYFFKKSGDKVLESGLHFFNGKIISDINQTPQQLIENINGK